MQLRLSRLHYPVTVLGPGRRAGIWVQGCTLACKGCVSRDTWPADDDKLTEIDAVMDWIAQRAGEATGITISGGEPFQQPDALAKLLRRLRAWAGSTGREIDLLCYSGYTYPWLTRRHAPILSLLDAIIPAPFREDRPTPLVWRGSANQALIPLSELGERRFGAFVSQDAERPAMQASLTDGVLWMVGIPERGAMARLEQACRDRGLDFAGASWNS